MASNNSLSPQGSPGDQVIQALSPSSSPVGRIDVHSHLLPGIDDGCKTVEESIGCARVLVANGYTHAFCTPHIWHKYVGISRESVPRMCAILLGELEKADAVPR